MYDIKYFLLMDKNRVPVNIALDDFTYDNHGRWATMCKKCAEGYNLNTKTLETVPGDEWCDVAGCTTKARYYVTL